MSMKLYVGGLSHDTVEAQLQTLFTEYGGVESVMIVKDKFSGQSKGFGFVEMKEIKDGQNAIKALNGKQIEGRAIVVNQARPQNTNRTNFSGGYRR